MPFPLLLIGGAALTWKLLASSGSSVGAAGETVTYSQVQALDAAADSVNGQVQSWAQSGPPGGLQFKMKWDAWYIGLQAWVTGALSGLPKNEFDAHQAKLAALSTEFTKLSAPKQAAPPPQAYSQPPASAPAPVAVVPALSVPPGLPKWAIPIGLGAVGVALIAKGLKR